MNAGSGVQSEMDECGYKMGTLPSCAPLSAGFVPWQQENPPKYSSGDALTRGTLFPGLDLPYLNIVNQDHPYAGTPLGELMALDFVIKELNLYLDTHANDKDALEMLHAMNKLMVEGTEKYVRMYGPITISDLVSGSEFTWLNNPWPWDYSERMATE
jgi:spore coat protein JB